MRRNNSFDSLDSLDNTPNQIQNYSQNERLEKLQSVLEMEDEFEKGDENEVKIIELFYEIQKLAANREAGIGSQEELEHRNIIQQKFRDVNKNNIADQEIGKFVAEEQDILSGLLKNINQDNQESLLKNQKIPQEYKTLFQQKLNINTPKIVNVTSPGGLRSPHPTAIPEKTAFSPFSDSNYVDSDDEIGSIPSELSMPKGKISANNSTRLVGLSSEHDSGSDSDRSK